VRLWPNRRRRERPEPPPLRELDVRVRAAERRAARLDATVRLLELERRRAAG